MTNVTPKDQASALRYLSGADVERCLPDVDRRLELAADALRALARGSAEMPPKLGVHPRAGALLHAMPAWLRDGDLVGLKWIAAFPDNKQRGLPAINGLIVLNDPDTGLPTWIMDAGRITAVRTAAVSGVAIRLFASSARRVALLGAGVQARSHLEVLRALLPEAEVLIYDRHPERARALADEQADSTGETDAGKRRRIVSVAPDARSAVAPADLVITVATLGASSQIMTADWLRPGAVVVAVDFATYASAEVAQRARLFAVDDEQQFLHYRGSGYFDRYPEPRTTIGAALAGAPAPSGQESGVDDRPVLVTHLGVGLADVLLADAIREQAERLGVGAVLPR